MSAGRPSKIVPRDASHKPQKRERGYRNAEFSAAVASLGVCMVCGAVTDTTHCHSNQSKHGKGKSIKSSDAAQFAACATCHSKIDQGGMNRLMREGIENLAIVMTYQFMSDKGFFDSGIPCTNDADVLINALEIGAIKLRADWRKL